MAVYRVIICNTPWFVCLGPGHHGVLPARQHRDAREAHGLACALPSRGQSLGRQLYGIGKPLLAAVSPSIVKSRWRTLDRSCAA